jgi:hypothetical protein
VPKSLGEDLDEIAIATQIEDLQPNCPRFASKTDSPLIKEKINLSILLILLPLEARHFEK